ncbi:hypothetical protein GM415_13195 [Pseudodesulfovibrio cashew]|uniref:APC family permease n=1 Tax=Pseudodesulfovibrio cashew TaxID=2678688 RepID=A0A6I6JFU2_9BACT|nr:hypothetical protein [Pseudodesulfovibrio cashew]QGY41041.1 hypothetical protein GM415_13195 [Pseudodesulfovibrio cashew]
MPTFPIPSIIVVVTALSVGSLLLFYRPLTDSSAWRATVTPLASIMGSGFLVCAPLLYANVGNYAVFAMAGLLALAYAVGSVVRFNIRYGEDIFEKHAPEDSCRDEHKAHVGHWNAACRVKVDEAADVLEKISHYALAGAYCVSVSYYLQLLASFALQPLSLTSAWIGKTLVTLILAGIGIIGTSRGLKGIEKVERIVVGFNLAMIAALVTGLVYHNAAHLTEGTWQLGQMPLPKDKFHILRILMGLLIVVQGFETSRFLGAEHSKEERIRTMRQAQLISAGIYLVFIAMMAVIMNGVSGAAQDGITAIVTLSGAVAPILPALITITAIGSQFSAATADDAGCSGLMEAIMTKRVPAKYAYLLVSSLAIALTWLTDVYQIISYASRAFALFYALQCVVALLVMRSSRAVEFSRRKAVMFGSLAAVCALVTLFGIPAG